jgi:aspartate aminotransferase-like enzyme
MCHKVVPVGRNLKKQGKIFTGGNNMGNLKQFLMIPGPTQVPQDVCLAGAKGMINHRSADFGKVFSKVVEGVKACYKTKNDVFIFNSSGTGAMEATVSNIISPGDKILGVSIGNFGQRFQKIAKAYGAEIIPLDFEWGQAADPAKVKEVLAQDTNKEIKAVIFQHNETSTGVVNDIQTIAKVVQEHGALVVVDAVSGLLAADLRMDEWGLDIVASGSQKAFMVPPGLGIVAVSPKAWKVIENTKDRHCFYFDLLTWRQFSEKGQTPWTPAISLFNQMEASLEMILGEGLDNILKRHARLRRATRAAAKALGFELLAKDEASASPAVTSIVPTGVDAEELRKICREKYGVTLAGGQGKMKGKLFRISHLGYIDQLEIIASFAAIEMALTEMGQKVELGKSVRVLQKELLAS